MMQTGGNRWRRLLANCLILLVRLRTSLGRRFSLGLSWIALEGRSGSGGDDGVAIWLPAKGPSGLGFGSPALEGALESGGLFRW